MAENRDWNEKCSVGRTHDKDLATLVRNAMYDSTKLVTNWATVFWKLSIRKWIQICQVFGSDAQFSLHVLGLGRRLENVPEMEVICSGIEMYVSGIGVATTIIAIFCNIYYIVILAWDLFYLSQSFTSVLPWSHCNNSWNTERCVSMEERTQSLVLHVNSKAKPSLFKRNLAVVFSGSSLLESCWSRWCLCHCHCCPCLRLGTPPRDGFQM